MSIQVSITMADGGESNTIAGADGTNIFMTIANQGAGAVTVIGASVSFTSTTVPGYCGQTYLPQGGVTIPGNSSVTLPPVSVVVFMPQAQSQTAASSGPPSVVGVALVSDGSAGVSVPIVLSVSPDVLVPPNDNTGLIKLAAGTGGTQQIYSNVIGPGMLDYSHPLTNSELYLFPSLFATA